MTIYLPDARSPLHPVALSEGAASLLPDQVRQALVWRVRIAADGDVTDVDVRRARVRSRGAYSYEQVQGALDAGTADEVFGRLRSAGRAREALQARRGGLDLRLPEQTVVVADGRYELVYRAPFRWRAGTPRCRSSSVSAPPGSCSTPVSVSCGRCRRRVRRPSTSCGGTPGPSGWPGRR